jgi:hypothetical protein
VTPTAGLTLDWRDWSHWSHRQRPCRICHGRTHLLDDAGLPAHKTCAEEEAADLAAATARRTQLR